MIYYFGSIVNWKQLFHLIHMEIEKFQSRKKDFYIEIFALLFIIFFFFIYTRVNISNVTKDYYSIGILCNNCHNIFLDFIAKDEHISLKNYNPSIYPPATDIFKYTDILLIVPPEIDKKIQDIESVDIKILIPPTPRAASSYHYITKKINEFNRLLFLKRLKKINITDSSLTEPIAIKIENINITPEYQIPDYKSIIKNANKRSKDKDNRKTMFPSDIADSTKINNPKISKKKEKTTADTIKNIKKIDYNNLKIDHNKEKLNFFEKSLEYSPGYQKKNLFPTEIFYLLILFIPAFIIANISAESFFREKKQDFLLHILMVSSPLKILITKILSTYIIFCSVLLTFSIILFRTQDYIFYILIYISYSIIFLFLILIDYLIVLFSLSITEYYVFSLILAILIQIYFFFPLLFLKTKTATIISPVSHVFNYLTGNILNHNLFFISIMFNLSIIALIFVIITLLFSVDFFISRSPLITICYKLSYYLTEKSAIISQNKEKSQGATRYHIPPNSLFFLYGIIAAIAAALFETFLYVFMIFLDLDSFIISVILVSPLFEEAIKSALIIIVIIVLYTTGKKLSFYNTLTLSLLTGIGFSASEKALTYLLINKYSALTEGYNLLFIVVNSALHSLFIFLSCIIFSLFLYKNRKISYNAKNSVLREPLTFYYIVSVIISGFTHATINYLLYITLIINLV